MATSRYVRLFVGILLFFSSAANAQQDKPKLKVGALIPLTGELALFGKDLLLGMQQALEDVAIEDKDLASRIEIVAKDYASKSQRAVDLAKEMVANRQADILIGPLTGTSTIAVYRAIESTQKPMISATATMPSLTRIGDTMYRSCLVDTYQGRALADFATRDLKKTKAAIMVDESSDYSKSIAAAFEQQLKAEGGTLVGRINYASGSSDFAKSIAQMQKLKPQVVLLPAYYHDANEIIRQTKEKGVRVTFLGTDAWDSPKFFKEGAREALKGHYYVTHFNGNDPDPAIRGFVQKFESKNNHAPTMYAAMGYDAIMLTADSFKRAKSNLATALNKAIASSQNVKSLMGNLSMNPQRDAMKGMDVMSTTTEGAKWKARLNLATTEATSPGVQ